MTAVGCGTVEVNPPQHSIKRREKCGLVRLAALEIVGTRVIRQLQRLHLAPEERESIEAFEKMANDIADIKQKHERQAVRP